MLLNIVTIDPSISGTALTVNEKNFFFTGYDKIYDKKGNLKKWFEACSDHASFIDIEDNIEKDSYSILEIRKLSNYHNIAESVKSTIASNIDKAAPTIVAIEGYSYSSDAGPLIDLVTYGTILRQKIKSEITNNIVIISPKSLKRCIAMWAYPDNLDKKVYRNNEGVAGGSFKKHDIFKALIENPHLTSEWIKLLASLADVCLSLKTIPKPIEDINDSYAMHQIVLTYTKKSDTIEQSLEILHNL